MRFTIMALDSMERGTNNRSNSPELIYIIIPILPLETNKFPWQRKPHPDTFYQCKFIFIYIP